MTKAEEINYLMLQHIKFKPNVSQRMKQYVVFLIRHHNYSQAQIKKHIKGVLV